MSSETCYGIIQAHFQYSGANTLELFTCNCEDIKNYNLFQASFAKFHFIKTPLFVIINVKNILVLLDFTSCVTEFLNYACLTYWISVYIHDIHVLIMCLLFVLYICTMIEGLGVE